MKVNSKAEDAAMARTARRAMAKTMLDITELNTACSNGNIELYGKVRPTREAAGGGANVKREFEALVENVRKVRGVNEVITFQVKLFQ